MKFFTILFALSASCCALAQSYLVTVETIVGNRSEDKFCFSLEKDVKQTKGFDGKLLAKRYRAKGFPHGGLAARAAQKAETKKLEELAELKPAEIVKKYLEQARNELESAQKSESAAVGRRESLEDKVKTLENLEELASRGAASFDAEYNEFRKRYGLTDEDINYKKLLQKRPRYTGDIEEIDYGSYCSMKIVKATEKKVYIDMNYAYSRINGSFYSDGNNNSNSITKHPIVERFEKLGVKDLKISIGKPYCFQFGRLSPEKARSLSEALSKSGIFGGGEGEESAGASVQPQETSELDAQGSYAEIKRNFASDGGRVVRVVITVKPER